ncbi:MAG: YbaK/EbsC family protein [Sphaerochaetaceae bacterium]|nr:YbaK/EbsC family protein [Sphaerochaetaceae bacterium]
MSLDTVKSYFSSLNALDKVIELSESSATVELAAAALGCLPAHIAKTMSFDAGGDTLLVVCAGDARIDNRKFKTEFGVKAKMVSPAEVEERTGHAPGGVCPFAVKEGVKTYLDISLKRFETVYPAAGNDSSAVRLSIGELETYSNHQSWVDVCRNWQ